MPSADAVRALAVKLDEWFGAAGAHPTLDKAAAALRAYADLLERQEARSAPLVEEADHDA